MLSRHIPWLIQAVVDQNRSETAQGTTSRKMNATTLNSMSGSEMHDKGIKTSRKGVREEPSLQRLLEVDTRCFSPSAISVSRSLNDSHLDFRSLVVALEDKVSSASARHPVTSIGISSPSFPSSSPAAAAPFLSTSSTSAEVTVAEEDDATVSWKKYGGKAKKRWPGAPPIGWRKDTAKARSYRPSQSTSKSLLPLSEKSKPFSKVPIETQEAPPPQFQLRSTQTPRQPSSLLAPLQNPKPTQEMSSASAPSTPTAGTTNEGMAAVCEPWCARAPRIVASQNKCCFGE